MELVPQNSQHYEWTTYLESCCIVGFPVVKPLPNKKIKGL